MVQEVPFHPSDLAFQAALVVLFLQGNREDQKVQVNQVVPEVLVDLKVPLCQPPQVFLIRQAPLEFQVLLVPLQVRTLQ